MSRRRHLPSWCLPRRLLLVLLVMLHVIATCVAADDVVAPHSDMTTSCQCNNGLVLPAQAQCTCVCFDRYLLPSCLYRADDVVPIELWFRASTDTAATRGSTRDDAATTTTAGDGSDCYFVGADVEYLLAWAFATDTSSFAYQYGNVVNGRIVAAPSTSSSLSSLSSSSSDTVTVVRAVVTMPGWAAQHLLADALQDNLHAYTLPVQTTTTTTTTTTSSSNNDKARAIASCYELVAVLDAQPSPPLPRSYTDVWLRIYASAQNWPETWYIGVDKLAWLIAAMLLVAGLIVVEQCTLYNMDYNVGGGVMHVWQTTRRHVATSRGASARGGDGSGGATTTSYAAGRLAYARASMRGTFARLLRHDERAAHTTTAAATTAAAAPRRRAQAPPPHAPPSALAQQQQQQGYGGGARGYYYYYDSNNNRIILPPRRHGGAAAAAAAAATSRTRSPAPLPATTRMT